MEGEKESFYIVGILTTIQWATAKWEAPSSKFIRNSSRNIFANATPEGSQTVTPKMGSQICQKPFAHDVQFSTVDTDALLSPDAENDIT